MAIQNQPKPNQPNQSKPQPPNVGSGQSKSNQGGQAQKAERPARDQQNVDPLEKTDPDQKPLQPAAKKS
jgi:hypothetical protein